MVHVDGEALFANGVVLFAPGRFDIVIQESVTIPREFFLIKSETSFVWPDKFERKGVLLERSTASSEVTGHKGWIGGAILSSGDLGTNVWHAELKCGIEYAHAANRAGNRKDEMFFGNFWFFNHDWSGFWLRFFFHGGHQGFGILASTVREFFGGEMRDSVGFAATFGKRL